MRIGHGYDYASNRTWREDAVAAANGKNRDEFYTYDGLRQLTGMDRGDLESDKSGIDGTPFHEEDFGLDPISAARILPGYGASDPQMVSWVARWAWIGSGLTANATYRLESSSPEPKEKPDIQQET